MEIVTGINYAVLWSGQVGKGVDRCFHYAGGELQRRPGPGEPRVLISGHTLFRRATREVEVPRPLVESQALCRQVDPHLLKLPSQHTLL